MKHVLEDANTIDHSVHPDSPRRNRPAYLDDPAYRTQAEQPIEEARTQPPPSKDWSKTPPAPQQPRGLSGTEPSKKDWSKIAQRHMPTTEEIIDNRKTWDSTAGSFGVVKFD